MDVRYCLASLLFSISMVSFAQTIRLTDAQKALNPTRSIEIFEDKTASLTMDEVIKQDFQPLESEMFAHPATRSAFWFRFTFQNTCPQDAWLELGCNFNWYLDFYSPLLPVPYRGGLMTKSSKFHPLYIDRLPLQPAGDTSTRTFYFRVVQLETGFELPMLIGTIQSLSLEKSKKDLLVGLYVGVLLVMVIYNSFLFFAIRDRIYLYYVLYLINALFFVSYLVYYPFIETLFSGLVDTTWWYRYFMVWAQGTVLFSGLFCMYYLNLKERLPKVRIWTLFLIFVLCAVIPFLNILGFDSVDLADLYQISILLFYFSCLVASYYLSFSHKEARLYAIGWTLLVFSVFVYVGVVNGLVPFNFFTHNILILGVGFEVSFFSLALADRINVLQQEKNQFQQELFAVLEDQNKVLEQKVKERTEEVLLMNEELQQQHEELVALNQSLEQVNSKLESTASSLNASIRYANRIQSAFLPTKEQLDAFFLECVIIYKPRDIVSGDFYWFDQIDPNLALFILADSTGHGVPGGFMSMIGGTILHQIVKNSKLYSPSSIIERLDETIISLLNQKHSSNNDGMDITVCLFEKKEGHTVVSFSASKQRIYYINQKDELVELRGDRYFIGGRKQEPLQINEIKFSLDAGKTMMLFTDGISDQQNDSGKIFGYKKLAKILLENHKSESLEEIKCSIENELAFFKGDSVQRDDMSLVLLRPQ